MQLWIAFDLYLWNIEHNTDEQLKSMDAVVNCFRFVSLKYWTQLPSGHIGKVSGCELLSICIFEILNTTLSVTGCILIVLWIAFDLYLWNIEHNTRARQYTATHVVNCFRFVSLKYWTQPGISSVTFNSSCELLSICIFEILNTTGFCTAVKVGWLWIAFDLYLWNIEHNDMQEFTWAEIVVNCFRFVSLKYWTQLISIISIYVSSCELLSICIFEILNTTTGNCSNCVFVLWIAFDLYLWNIEHNSILYWSSSLVVVNCFRFVSLKYWTQRGSLGWKERSCCELLSICIFEILNTTEIREQETANTLWIAFDLYLWNIEHNWTADSYIGLTLWIAFDLYLWNIEHNSRLLQHPLNLVVNCFRFVSLKYWTQPTVNLILSLFSCELLSICIFEILNTTIYTLLCPRWLLWIAFDLYLWNIEHNFINSW